MPTTKKTEKIVTKMPPGLDI